MRKKNLDDGTVRGLILSGDYLNVGEAVAIQSIVDGKVSWTLLGGGLCSDVMTVSEENNKYDFFEEAEEHAVDVVTLCRRKLKKEAIILYSVATFYSFEDGIVFTEDKIFTFAQKKLEYIITYEEIDEVDFTEDSIIIRVKEGSEVSLYCGDDEKYSRNMYNLIMDIKDRVDESQTI